MTYYHFAHSNDFSWPIVLVAMVANESTTAYFQVKVKNCSTPLVVMFNTQVLYIYIIGIHTSNKNRIPLTIASALTSGQRFAPPILSL